MTVVTLQNQKISFNSAVALMDDEIREDLHAKLTPCSEQAFLDAYVKAHAEKFDGEEFKAW